MDPITLVELFTMGLFLVAVIHLMVICHVYYIRDTKHYFDNFLPVT